MPITRTIPVPRGAAMALTTTALFAAAAAPHAALAADWTPSTAAPTPGSNAQLTTGVNTAYQDGGTATQTFIDVTLGPPPSTVAHIGTRTPGGAFAEQLTIPSTQTALPSDAALAVAPNGAAVVALTELQSTNPATAADKYVAYYRPAGSTTWEGPTTIAADAQKASAAPTVAVAISADGTAAVGVTHPEPNDTPSEPAPGESDQQLDVAIHAAGGAGFAPATRLSQPNRSVGAPHLAFDAHGNLTAAFGVRTSEGASASESDDQWYLGVRRRSASTGSFSSVEDVSGSSNKASTSDGALGVNDRGDAVLSFQTVATNPTDLAVWSVTRSGPNGSWTAPQRLTPGDGLPQFAAVSPNGTAYASFTLLGSSSAGDCPAISRGAVGAPMSAGRCVGPVGLDSYSSKIAFSGDDAVYGFAAFTPGNQNDGSMLAGRWGDTAPLPDVAHDTDVPGQLFGLGAVTADGTGNVLIDWTGATSGHRWTQYDATAPTIADLTVPATTMAGTAIGVSATATDRWSALGAHEPTWDFGDGTAPVTGPAATHVYAAAGTYTVTFHAADAAGNVATRTAAVQVAAAAGGPAPTPTDTLAPTVSLTLPSKKKLHLPSAYRTLHGIVADGGLSSGVASVEIVVERKIGKTYQALVGKHFKAFKTKAKAEAAFTKALVADHAWTAKLPKLKPGTYTVLVRATDHAGNVSKVGRTTLKLR
ncbi:MAG: PKD domain-containing protein [Patulibacter sp.]|nr:PKD domain-containing protein [Patulibacter sp.]